MTPLRSAAPPKSPRDTVSRTTTTSPSGAAVPSEREDATLASTQEIQAGLGEILEEVAGVAPADATPEKSFTDDLDVDSLSMVEVVVAAEEKFGVSIPDDEVKNLKTVGDAVAFIERAQG